jgi:hypothetical protein
LLQQLDRIPNVYKGGAAGAAVGMGMNSIELPKRPDRHMQAQTLQVESVEEHIVIA